MKMSTKSFCLIVSTIIAVLPQESSAQTPIDAEEISSMRTNTVLINGRFSPEAWKNSLHKAKPSEIDDFSGKTCKSGSGEIDRTKLWRQFLQDFNLIGMPRNTVIELLGVEGSKDSYCLFSDGIDSFENISIDYDKDDRVKSWSLRHLNKHGPYYSTNVLYLYPNSLVLPNGSHVRVIEKSDLAKYQKYEKKEAIF